MSYESRHLARHKVRYDNNNDDNELIFQCVRNGGKVTPSSAVITIYPPGDDTAIETSQAMAVSGTLCTYSINTTTTADYPVATGYKAVITVTDAGAVTYEDTIYFDVCLEVPQGRITRDQLVALDGRLRNMDHAGDSDFSEIIQAVWDEVQYDIESRTVEGKQLLDSMIIDRGRLSVAVRFLILARILRPKGHAEDADYYEKQYDMKLGQLFSGFKHDVNEDGHEDYEQTLANIINLTG